MHLDASSYKFMNIFQKLLAEMGCNIQHADIGGPVFLHWSIHMHKNVYMRDMYVKLWEMY